MSDQTNLSGREQQILQLVATGLTNREIAQKLNISPNTVKVHLSNIFEKIDVSSRTEATMFGIEHGIVDVSGVENGETTLNWQEFVKKNIWVFIPVFMIMVALLFGLGSVFLFMKPKPTPVNLVDIPDRWQELAPMPEARANMAAVGYDGNIYAIAGEGPEGVSGSVFRYLTAEDRWERLRDKPTPVADVEGALIGEKIYVPGGRLADGSPTDVLEIYDPRQDIWEKGTSLPKKISNYAMADFEGKLYIFGGWDGEKPLTDVYVYDPEEDVWGARTPMAIARRDSIAVLVQSKILLLGGKNLKEDFFVHEIYYPDRDGTQEIPWEEIANNFLDTPFCVQSLGEILISFSKSDRSEASVSYFLSQENQWVSGEIIEEFYVKDGIASTSLQGNVYFLGGKDENMSITSFFAKYKGTYIVTFPNLAQ